MPAGARLSLRTVTFSKERVSHHPPIFAVLALRRNDKKEILLSSNIVVALHPIAPSRAAHTVCVCCWRLQPPTAREKNSRFSVRAFDRDDSTTHAILDPISALIGPRDGLALPPTADAQPVTADVCAGSHLQGVSLPLA
jgi:hypothetical protein